MGYETRLYVGHLSQQTSSIDGDKTYFLKIAMIDLSKCYGDEKDPFSKLIDEATSKENKRNFKKVYWSDLINIEREKIVKTIFDEFDFIKEKGKYKNIKALLGDKREEVEKNIDGIAKLFEEWESETNKDSYGSYMRAVPIKEVYEAMLKSNAMCLIEEEHTYRRYDAALALLKSLMEGFPHQKPTKNHDPNLYCVLYGH